MQSCSRQIFYLPVSVQCIRFPSSFYVHLPLLIKWQREWLTTESRLLPPTPTLLHWQARTHMHIYAEENSNSSFMFHGPISMTRAPRIRVKNCQSSALWEHLDSEGHLRTKGRSRAGRWKREIWVSWNAQGEKWRNVLMILWKISQYLLCKCGAGGGVAPEAIIPPSVLALSITK